MVRTFLPWSLTLAQPTILAIQFLHGMKKSILYFIDCSFLVDVTEKRDHHTLTPVQRDLLSYTLELWEKTIFKSFLRFECALFSRFSTFFNFTHRRKKHLGVNGRIFLSLSFSIVCLFVLYGEKWSSLFSFLGSEPKAIRMNQSDPYKILVNLFARRWICTNIASIGWYFLA